ncbi:LysM peptidoglycan-binding domain-containing protein [candidate division WOR-3 bacterium]|nr:LysM peptidoglycan-binding domain-containing protein [candidate division WOR-3 bacterium]
MKKFSFVIFIILAFSSVLFAQKKHIVVKGECLWFIAGDYYNDPFLWPVIYEANKDSIADPHWIYPGEVFVIPNVPAEQVSIPPTEEGLVMEVKGTKGKVQEELKTTTGTKEEELREKIGEALLFSVVQAENYAFTAKAALLAGFITRDGNLGIGKISKRIKYPPDFQGASTVLGDDVEINVGTADGIQVGNNYVIFRYDKAVGRYGRIVRIKGVLKISEADENVSTAKITESYETIDAGDRIMEYTPPEMVIGEATPITDELEGKIIALKEDDPIIKPFAVVYIEPGSGSVQLGDVFLIYKEGTDNLIVPLGKIQIVDVREETASGYITSIMGKTEISNGNKIKLVGRIGG